MKQVAGPGNRQQPTDGAARLHLPAGVSPKAVRAQVERILASELFASSERPAAEKSQAR